MNRQFMIPTEMVPFQMSLSTRRSNIVMVPLSEKRHRLYKHEIPEVIRGLILRLEKLTEERKEEEKAKTTFLTLYRLMFVRKGGRPKYPEFSWNDAAAFIDIYKDET